MCYTKLIAARRLLCTAARPIHLQVWNTWLQRYIDHVCFEACAMMPSIAIAEFSAMNRVRRSTVTAAQVASWIEYEYLTQRLLFTHGANVPRTFAQIGNAVLMEYIGDVGEPAPRLSDVVLEVEDAQPLFSCIMDNIELALKHGRIHGDLSGYNILYWHEAVTLIDFAQAVDPYHNSDVFSLFLRDIERICRYFAQYNVQCNANELAREIWSGHMGPIPELI